MRFGPHGEQVAAGLSLPGSLEGLASDVTLAWFRHGVIDVELRDHLLSERPARRSEIADLWAAEPSPDEEDDDLVGFLSGSEAHQLEAHLRRLTEATASGMSADIKVIELTELIGGVLVDVEVTVYGNFEDEKVAVAPVEKFLSGQWAAPNSHTTYDHDDQRLIFAAHAFVSSEHLHPVDQAADASSGSEK